MTIAGPPAWVLSLAPITPAAIKVEIDLVSPAAFIASAANVFTLDASTDQLDVTVVEEDTAPDTFVLDSAGRPGTLDTFALGGDDEAANWTDITDSVRRIGWRCARRNGIDQADPATLVMDLDDPGRRFDPTNLAGPFVAGGRSLLTASRRVKVTALWGGQWWPIGFGWSTNWAPTYLEPGMATVQLTCRGTLGQLADVQPAAQPAPIGGGLTFDEHLGIVFDIAGVDRVWLAAETGLAPMQAHTFSQNCLSTAKLLADSEGGVLHDGPDGVVRARRRNHRLTDPRSADGTATLTDAPTIDPGGIAYETIGVLSDAAEMVTVANVARVGGTSATIVADTAPRYGIKTWTRTDLLCQTDADAQAVGGLKVVQFRETQIRFTNATVSPLFAPEATWFVLSSAIGDRVRCRLRPLAAAAVVGSEIDRDAFIEGIEHEIDAPTATWTTTFTLSDASTFRPFTLSGDTQPESPLDGPDFLP
jgi:hypothetical protein